MAVELGHEWNPDEEEVFIDKSNEEIVYDKAVVNRIARCTGHLRSVKTMGSFPSP